MNQAGQENRRIVTREQARVLSPQERLSSIDLENLDFLEVVDRVLATPELLTEIGEEHLDEYRQALLEDAGSGNNKALNIVRLHNQYFPESSILIPSEYLTDLTEVENPDWLIPGLVLREGLTLLHGESGSYKTIVTLHMGHALFTGTPFLSIPINGNHRVLYVEQDEGLSIMKDQVQKIGFPREEFVCFRFPVLWHNDQFNPHFRATLKMYKPDVVFLDAYTSLGIDDITRPSSALCMDALRRIAAERKIAFVILHHENASGKQMGSGLHVAKVDSEIQTTVTKGQEFDTVMLTQRKVRGQSLEPVYIKADKETLRLERRLNMTIAQMVRDMQAGGLTNDEILRRFTGAQREAARRALSRERIRANRHREEV